MVKNRPGQLGVGHHYMRSTVFAITVVLLCVWIAAATGLLFWVFHAAEKASPAKQPSLGRAGVMVFGILIISVLLLLGVVIHYIKSRLTQPLRPPAKTAFESAWEEAGRRLKAEDAPPVEPYEPPEPPEGEQRE